MHSCIIVEKGLPLTKAEKAIVFLHGRGGTADDIMRLKREFGNEKFYYAAPQATDFSWYPRSFLSPVIQNEPWLTSAIEVVKQLTDNIASFIGKENLFIIGFSQGACLALEASSRFAGRYGGIVAFTGGLIGDALNPDNYKGDFNGTAIFMGTSDNDPHVPLKRCEESKELLQSLGANVILEIYPGMPHMISTQEIESVKFLMDL